MEKNPVTGEVHASEPLQCLTLSTLGGRDINGQSGAEELFQEMLQEVLKNVARLDAPATAKREIIMKIIFEPDADRSCGIVEVQAQVKLATLNSAHGKLAFGVQFGKQIAVPLVETMPLFESKPAAPVVMPPVAKTGTND